MLAIVDIKKEAAERCAGGSEPSPCDIRDRAVVAAALERFGTVDVLVNNVMAARIGVPFEKITDDDLELVSGPA